MVVNSPTTGGASSIALTATGGNTGLATLFGAPTAGNRGLATGAVVPTNPLAIVAGTNDRINPVNGLVVNAPRNTLDFLVGVTQALSPDAIVQSNITYSRGHGYYSDPYKPLDTRPDERRIFAWLTRYNHHMPDTDATLRLGYRFLHDSFGSTSNTLEAAWLQPLPAGWSAAPSIRDYTQSAASFYQNPPFPAGYSPGQFYTADTRLAAFGAFTVGVTLAKALPDGWSANLRLDFYRQRSDWRVGGDGSPDIEPFSARWILLGIAKTF